ncbi:sugar O-acetyltransferase [Aerococcaceae bacterium DSM 111021]|uniref:sugar O-acetyltransferase n=1 Tax=unclassified Ruoffia TaxID=2862149 RepID=UPI001DC25437|nr:sugar O-acetyltransferase [Aerococcaceae bacterium DSM 111021]
MNTEDIYNKMHSGEIYIENSETLNDQAKYRDLLFHFNHTLPSETKKVRSILTDLLGAMGENSYIEPPFHANWGKNTYIGNNVYINFSLTIVDDTRVEIKDHVMIGPNVTISTASHPLEPELRLKGAQFNKPVTIEKNVWIGANVTIFPGVTIGENSVVGANSTVTKDIPSNVLAFGTPCKVIKRI